MVVLLYLKYLILKDILDIMIENVDVFILKILVLNEKYEMIKSDLLLL